MTSIEFFLHPAEPNKWYKVSVEYIEEEDPKVEIKPVE